MQKGEPVFALHAKINMEHFSASAYSNRKTGTHFWGIRAEHFSKPEYVLVRIFCNLTVTGDCRGRVSPQASDIARGVCHHVNGC
jgi:hypothetical protein